MKPGWLWAGVGAVILVATLAISAWYKQQSVRQPEMTKSGPGVPPSPGAGTVAAKPASTAAGLERDTASARSARNRPERDRSDRP